MGYVGNLGLGKVHYVNKKLKTSTQDTKFSSVRPIPYLYLRETLTKIHCQQYGLQLLKKKKYELQLHSTKPHISYSDSHQHKTQITIHP